MFFRTLFIGIVLAAGAFAQLNSFPKVSYFRETFQKANTTVEIKDPVRLKDFVVDGKLELSLKDYLSLVMANNTNIQIQQLAIETPKNAIQRALGAWDPAVNGSFNSQRSRQLTTNVLEGGQQVTSLTQPVSLRFNQPLDLGGNYFVQYNANKTATSNSNVTFNPSLTSNLQVGFTQALLRNRGRYVNRLNVMVARSNLRVSEYALRTALIQSISNAETFYWNVILERENLKVAESGRDAAAEYLNYMTRQLDLGALSPLDIYNPKQRVAEAELQVSQSVFRLRAAEDSLRLQIAADLDPTIRVLPLVLTEIAEMADAETLTVDAEASVQNAIANRPDLKGAAQRLDVDDLQIHGARNSLLPQLNLTGQYQTQGLGGMLYSRPPTIPGEIPPPPQLIAPGGFGDAFTQMFGFGYPIYSFGLQLNLPIRNRAASMDLADAVVRKKSDTLQIRQLQETTRLNVLNAVTNINGSKEQLKLAKIQRDFSKLNYDAMLKKYELGTEINQNVITAQQNLTAAEFNVVQNQINMRRNLLQLQTQTGELLDIRGIIVQ